MSTDAPHTIGRWLRDRAAATPQRVAIDDRGVLVDYGTLLRRAESAAQAFGAAGYGAGSRIATLSGNSTDHVVAFFASAFLGAAFVPLSWRLTPPELAELLARSSADLLLFEEDYQAQALAALALAADSAPPAVRLGDQEARIPSAASPRPQRGVQDDDPLLVIFTSGSEAAPKGVVLTHANCFWTNLSLAQKMPLTADDVVLAALPQHHVAAWNVQPLLAWWVGARVVLERSFHPARVLQLIRERGITTMMGVPTQYRMLEDAVDWDDADISSLRSVLVGGATIPEDLGRRWAEHGVRLNQGYGLTEAGPNVLFLPAEDVARHPGAVGRPYPFVDTRLTDPETGLVLEGAATGELWVRGPGVFAGYLDDPETTARARKDGWLRTGDLVQRDEDGLHRVVDRLKNIFISGGENVAPAEVEEALLAHPLVAAVAVVAVPDRVWGERGVAFIATTGPLTADELLAVARERLAAFKLPVRIQFLDDFPMTSLGKVDRRRLRTMAAELEGARA